jgi:DNA anti-recombination protein RmuC
MQADFEARLAKVQREMIAVDEQINTALDYLDAELPKVAGQAKADLEVQRAKMRADREKLNAQLKASYETEVKHIKNEIARMQTWAKTTAEQNRAKINAQLDILYKQAGEVEEQIENLHVEHVQTWNENKAKVERALAALRQGREKAMADLQEGYKKAKQEFKKSA